MLARLLPLDLERESNKARNRLLMREAGLSEDEIHMWSLPVTTASSKGKGKARQSRSKEDTEGSDVDEEEARDENDVDNELQRPHENEESGEDKSDDDENGVKDAGPPAKTLRERGVIKKPVTRRSGRKTRISSPPPIDFPSLISIPKPPKVNKTGWPQWIIASHQFLTTPDLGGDFASAVSWWVAVERAYGFQTSVGYSLLIILFHYSHLFSSLEHYRLPRDQRKSDIGSHTSVVNSTNPRIFQTSQPTRRGGGYGGRLCSLTGARMMSTCLYASL